MSQTSSFLSPRRANGLVHSAHDRVAVMLLDARVISQLCDLSIREAKIVL